MQISTNVIESYDTADFPQLANLYDENVLEVYVWATGQSVRNDYGVPGSPVWYDIEDIMIDTYEINGVTYTHKSLTEKFGAEVADNLHEISAEVTAEKDEWE